MLEEICLSEDIEGTVLQVLAELEVVDTGKINKHSDLYDAGMTSHASVKLMLALEDTFDIEFPDEMLQRESFSSVDVISSSLSRILAQA